MTVTRSGALPPEGDRADEVSALAAPAAVGTAPSRVGLHGHWQTLRPFLTQLLAARPAPPSRHWRTALHDPVVGEVRLTGRLHELPGPELLVVVHGLGGSHRSMYMLDAARVAIASGVSCLRLNLRGADRRGSDYYHAGLTVDLRAALEARDLARFESIYVLGYSLGGHVTLRLAAEGLPPRVRSVAAICAPIDLEAGAVEIDKPRSALYRTKLLDGLKEIYAVVASRREVPVPLPEARRIRTLREWDERIVAPRHGFASALDYYRRASVGPLLEAVEAPTLAVVAERDPVVFTHTVRPHLTRQSKVRTVFLERGGHVGFPADIDLGLTDRGGARDGLEAQVLGWLRSPS
ncbi:MAG: alpha/beta fold hydrolase [Myxococcales bacterium]|nr:alpha/beta fold hydrolase [Myxococcales bacterium]